MAKQVNNTVTQARVEQMVEVGRQLVDDRAAYMAWYMGLTDAEEAAYIQHNLTNFKPLKCTCHPDGSSTMPCAKHGIK